ncbi:MAG: PIN domain-containing protein [Xanthobacteraceae bacterium]|nr:PIN domain-containing protein [Xanthobacteraceae bacterium]MBV9628942.1 PIN domain-containing protein [Xanthobacteraceae bacterium]
MSGRVFLDTGIFIAALTKRDRLHAHAAELFGRAATAWTTSLLVVSEGYSWFLHRHGEEAARDFHAFLITLKGLDLLAVTADDHRRAVQILDRFRGAKLTYVDAASLAYIQQKKIRTVWSTDHHLGLTGAEILPRF